MNQLFPLESVRRLMGLRDRMEQLTQPWPGFLGYPVAEGETLRGAWVPPVDIRETATAIEVTAELPGVDPKKVDVSVQNNVLTIRGERTHDEIKDSETLHRIEREYGVFERTFTLPRSVDPDRIAASYKDGVLKVTLPKREEAKPKSIKVEVSAT